MTFIVGGFVFMLAKLEHCSVKVDKSLSIKQQHMLSFNCVSESLKSAPYTSHEVGPLLNGLCYQLRTNF